MTPLEFALYRIARNPDDTGSEALAGLARSIRPGRGERIDHAVARVQQLVALLQRDAAIAQALQAHLENVLIARYQRFIYSESGILGNEGFFSALGRRVFGRLLPDAPDERFLKDLVLVVFPCKDDYLWLEAVPETAWRALREILECASQRPDALPGHAQRETLEAVRMLSQRLAAIGLMPEIIRYYPELAEYESPFLAQNEEVIEFIRFAQAAMADADAPWPDDRHIHVLLDQCRMYVVRIEKRSREAGAGVHLTYLLKRIEQISARIELLTRLASPQSEDENASERIDEHHRFLIDLVRQENRRFSVRDLVGTSVQLIARQITEHASKTGEHYITGSRREYWQMFRAAAGAGLIVGFMALFKVLIAKLHLPPFWEAAGFSLNYGLGFILVHLLHFTIATKQPAMTAAALAAALDKANTRTERLDVLSDLAAQVCRTQWVAILGNVLVGFAASFGIACALQQGLGVDPIGVEKAHHMVADLNPVLSFALPHAAIAGVYLFLAGLVSGYYDNKAIYNRVPERLRRVEWLRRLIGPARLARLADYVERNLGALAGNFLFGCMLGSTATIGLLLGLPLDIRHVTFAAANFAYALATPGEAMTWATAAVTVAGIALIGLTNLTVSFGLAMRVALRSRGMRIESRSELLRHLWSRLWTNPRDFFWPPRDVDAPKTTDEPA